MDDRYQRATGWLRCHIGSCTQPVHTNGMCLTHWHNSLKPPRIEVTRNEHQWHAEQGREFDEDALLRRRFSPGASS